MAALCIDVWPFARLGRATTQPPRLGGTAAPFVIVPLPACLALALSPLPLCLLAEPSLPLACLRTFFKAIPYHF